MERRYQVFISSTFRDLVEERQSLQRAILELDHFPAGMELFPAGDDAAWDLIKDVIESSDYYALIIGGRYGSLDKEGIGYTEKEYDYALSLRKPVIPLLHKNPDNLPRDKTEIEEASWKKLLDFRAKVEKRHTCVYWTSANELRAQVIVGLTSAFKRHPAVGWVRASEVPSDASLKETLALRRRLAELEQQLAASDTNPPAGAAGLMQGDDEYEVVFSFEAKVPEDHFDEKTLTYEGKIHLTWNEVFAAVAPSMINEAQDYRLKADLKRYFEKRAREDVAQNARLKGRLLKNFRFDDFTVDTCLVQFRALGLVKENTKARSVKDTSTYWTLTPFGDYAMVQLRALRRVPLASSTSAAEVSAGVKDGAT
jgi:hypothetical protein